MAKSYWLETYGCQMNVAESSSLELHLKALGWQVAKTIEESDLVIVNSCAVRESAEKRVWGRIAYFKTFKKRHFKVVLMGCMAQRLKEEIQKKEPFIDLVVGNFSKEAFLELLRNPSHHDEAFDFPFPHSTSTSFSPQRQSLLQEEKEFRFASRYFASGSHSALVPIMHGCNNFCTYCIVPYVRGREISRPMNDIVEEINQLVSTGAKEITLLGQNVNSYCFQSDHGSIDFPQLLEILCEKTKVQWLRFVSSHPKDLSDRLIAVMAAYSPICNQIHLAMQHGSNPILQAMNRKYTIEHFQSLIKRLREAIPTIAISTDLLIGFPGESEADFEKTLEAVAKIRFDDAFTYYYNRRSGTVAANMSNQLPLEVKKERLSRLIQLQRKITYENKLPLLGKTMQVMVEAPSHRNKKEWLGRTECNRMVIFPSQAIQIGDFCQVRLLTVQGSVFKGEVCE